MIALPILMGVSGAVLIIAVLHDVAFRTIPNWMPALLAIMGAAARALDGTLPTGLLAFSLIGLGAALCWHRGWLGGGDVKLLASCALLVPPAFAMPLVLDTALAGGVLALTYLILGRIVTAPPIARPDDLLLRIVRAEQFRVSRGGPLPYASAIAAGALLILLKG